MKPLELKVYEIFKAKFGQEEANTIIEFLEVKAESKYLEKKDVLATKEDVADAKSEIIKWMFVFLIGTVVTIIGSIFAILKVFFNK